MEVDDAPAMKLQPMSFSTKSFVIPRSASRTTTRLSLSRLLDSTLIGREHELAVNLISPFNEHHGDETVLINQAMGKPQMLVLLPTDKRLLGDLTLFAKTDKYVRQNNTSGLADSRRVILAEKETKTNSARPTFANIWNICFQSLKSL